MQTIEREITLAELATMMLIDTKRIDVHDIDDLGLEVETPTGWGLVSSYVVKERTEGWQLRDLLASPVHRVLVEKEWKRVKDVAGAKPSGQMIDVVDLEVPGAECYVANGFVNHNTTPGG